MVCERLQVRPQGKTLLGGMLYYWLDNINLIVTDLGLCFQTRRNVESETKFVELLLVNDNRQVREAF